MIPISSLNYRIFELKEFFKDFSFALGYRDIMRLSWNISKRILHRISRLLLPNTWWWEVVHAAYECSKVDGFRDLVGYRFLIIKILYHKKEIANLNSGIEPTYSSYVSSYVSNISFLE